MMQLSSSCIAVAQPAEHQPWDTASVIPKDDSAVLTTLLPLVVLLLVFGAMLVSSMGGLATLD
jgi:hypothetical protein